MNRTARFLATTVMIGSMAVGLSGCLIAAVPLVMGAAAAVGGFALYKTVQTTGGGTVKISFDSKDSKKAATPPPLPAGNSVVIYQGGARDRKFAEALQASGKFRVSETSEKAYDAACRNARRADFAMGAVDEGQSVNSNMLSFSRGNATQTYDLQAYSCSSHQIVWTDKMQVIIESGSKPTVQSEIDGIAGQAWADRVVQTRS